MPDNPWQVLPAHLDSEMRFQMALLVAHRQIYHSHFVENPTVNRAVGFHLHGYRRKDHWRIVTMLTPWMLARLCFTDTPPEIPIPDGWRAEQRADADYQLLGPSVDLPDELGGGKAHLNYHTTLGHYLLQPITLNMEPYGNSQEAFEAWSHFIETRDESMKQMQGEYSWHKGVSRLELVGKYFRA